MVGRAGRADWAAQVTACQAGVGESVPEWEGSGVTRRGLVTLRKGRYQRQLLPERRQLDPGGASKPKILRSPSKQGILIK